MDDEESSVRRTPEELCTLYEKYPEIRDIITEGREDARFIRQFLSNVPGVEGLEYQVYAVSDRVHLPDGEILASGYDTGARGRVLAFVKLAQSWGEKSRPGLTCIVDADFAHLRDDLPKADVLIPTDFGSIEGYTLDSRVLQKFLSISVHREDVTGPELLAKIVPILNEIYIARAVMHWSQQGIALNLKFIRKLNLAKAFAESLVERHFPGAAFAQALALMKAELVQLRSQVASSGDARKSARGHDIAHVVIMTLGLANKWADNEVVERNLMACIEHNHVASQPLFVGLVQRVKAS